MKQVVIENPIINSPFEEPNRHHEFDGDGNPTGEVKPGRRISNYFIPIAKPRKKTKQAQLFISPERGCENGGAEGWEAGRVSKRAQAAR